MCKSLFQETETFLFSEDGNFYSRIFIWNGLKILNIG